MHTAEWAGQRLWTASSSPFVLFGVYVLHRRLPDMTSTLALVIVVGKLSACCHSRPFLSAFAASLLSCATRPSIAIVFINVIIINIVIIVIVVIVVVMMIVALMVVHVMCKIVVKASSVWPFIVNIIVIVSMVIIVSVMMVMHVR